MLDMFAGLCRKKGTRGASLFLRTLSLRHVIFTPSDTHQSSGICHCGQAGEQGNTQHSDCKSGISGNFCLALRANCRFIISAERSERWEGVWRAAQRLLFQIWQKSVEGRRPSGAHVLASWHARWRSGRVPRYPARRWDASHRDQEESLVWLLPGRFRQGLSVFLMDPDGSWWILMDGQPARNLAAARSHFQLATKMVCSSGRVCWHWHPKRASGMLRAEKCQKVPKGSKRIFTTLP